jgi:hypothetical protein
VLVAPWEVTPGCADVREDRRRPAEHIVLEHDAGVQGDTVLELDVVADRAAGGDEDVCPKLQCRPITTSPMTWQKCQILVPPPMETGSSTTAIG